MHGWSRTEPKRTQSHTTHPQKNGLPPHTNVFVATSKPPHNANPTSIRLDYVRRMRRNGLLRSPSSLNKKIASSVAVARINSKLAPTPSSILDTFHTRYDTAVSFRIKTRVTAKIRRSQISTSSEVEGPLREARKTVYHEYALSVHSATQGGFLVTAAPEVTVTARVHIYKWPTEASTLHPYTRSQRNKKIQNIVVAFRDTPRFSRRSRRVTMLRRT